MKGTPFTQPNTQHNKQINTKLQEQKHLHSIIFNKMSLQHSDNNHLQPCGCLLHLSAKWNHNLPSKIES